MEGKISFIIPAYNAEKTIKKCINSIQIQDYKNIEIIIIDDGSMDSTYEVCKSLMKDDKRIKLIKTENRGVSAARNLGIEVCTGEFLCFIDSDDYYSNDFLSENIKLLKDKDIDLIVFGYISTHRNIKKEEPLGNQSGICEIKDYIKIYSDMRFIMHFNVLWNKIYNKKIIIDNNITFDESTNLGEDAFFNYNYYLYIQKIYINYKCYYNYIDLNQDSLSRKYLSVLDLWNTYDSILDKFYKLVKEKNIYDYYYKQYQGYILGVINHFQNNMFNDKNEAKLLNDLILNRFDIYEIHSYYYKNKMDKLILILIKKKYVKALIMLIKIRAIIKEVKEYVKK